MSTATAAQAPTAGALASQAAFEAMFDHKPQVDLRTPADVKAQALAENWR